MIESIYLPILTLSFIQGPLFSSYLLNKIKEFDTPENVSITDVKRGFDPVLKYIFEMVIKHNPDDIENPYYDYEEDNFLRIEFETPESLRYQKLDWLNVQIKSVVREYDESVGLCFFYHESNTRFLEDSIAIVFKDDEVKIYEDNEIDDFRDLQSMAAFLNCYWYLDDIQIEEQYPDLTAKLFLLFG